MTLLSPAEIRARILKLWDSQRILRGWLTDEPLFPYEIPTRLPSGRELAKRYSEVQAAIADLRAESQGERGYGYHLIEETVANQQIGTQRLPVRVVVADREQALRLIGKARDFARFVRLVEETRMAMPELAGLLQVKPLSVLAHAEAWPKLLQVCAYFRTHPRPGCYLREIDLPGIDTKFVEAHKALLSEMLDAVLPADTVDAKATGIKNFERRYGLRCDSPGIRFRWLDPSLAPQGLRDMQVPLEDFARLCPQVERVFITENKVNFLAFPEVPASLAVFGQGYAIQAIAGIDWLEERSLYYWGDLDTHGFSILSQLRAGHGHVTSLLMDEATLLAHRESWGEEPAESRVMIEPANLTPAEAEVYRGLRDGRWKHCLRLEQERIAYPWLLSGIAHALAEKVR